MPTYIDTTNLSPATISTLQGPIISQIQITTSAYVVKDDTAVSTSGGYIQITGANFTAGTQVVIGTAAATSVTYVNSTTLNVQVPAQSAGTYVVYVTTNTGSVAILVNGLTYSGDPAWVTGSTLTAGQIDTPISIQLSATGDAPVTYVLQAGSSLPPGVTLSSGGLLSGTVTGISSETVYNFTIEAIDGQAQESPRTFSITITANDQYFEYVTSLLSAATPTSTFVTDASTNGFAVTVNGDTRPSNFGPYTPGYYSGYFDGDGDNLILSPNAAFSFGTGDFTVEFWVYYPPYSNVDGKMVLDSRPTSTNGPYWCFGANGSGVMTFTTMTSGGVTISDTVARTNQWVHYAATRSGTSLRLFANGTQVASATNSDNISSSDLRIGTNAYAGSAPTTQWVGYISNVRIVKGTAVYTSNFTPSTTPLTAVANTSLLTCQSNRFIDNSTNNFAITRNGDTLISGFDPFVPSSSFAGLGSGFFDGTGDYLSVPNDAAFNLSTGSWTIECWVYMTAGSGYRTFISKRTGATSQWELGIDPSSYLYFYTSSVYASSTVVPNNIWTHCAASYDGTNLRLFVNGVVVLTQAGITAAAGSDPVFIGQCHASSQPITGYLSNVRVVKGTAVYTGAFTPSTTPLTAIANTSLLTLQNNQPNNNSMFLDGSTNNFNVTRNGNTTQGTFSPYGGGWSNYFGTAQFKLSTTGMTALGSDFTLELWIYPTSFNDYNTIFDNRTSDGDASGLVLGLTSAAKVYFYTNAAFQITTATSISLNTWTHIALVRSGAGSGNVKIYINGVADANTATYTTSFTRTAPSIGDDWGTRSNLQYYGYLSNLRATTSALYTGSFTPSTTPLTAISGTVLLTCQSNRFIDNSFSALTMTVTGTPTIQRFNPFNPVLTTPTSYSGYFDGSAAFLSLADNTAFNFGTGDATVEFWFNSPGTSNNYPGIISSVDYNTSGSASIRFDNTGYKGKVFMYINGGGDPVIASTSTISYNTWTHVAITRSGTSLKMYINGTLDTTVTISVSLGWYLSYGGMRIGRGFDVDGASAYFPGYVSNVRLVKGSVVYTANFTPSTTPLTAIANTSLLTCQSATFIDNSTNNFTITANGAATPRQFNPFGWTSTTGSSAAYTPALYGGSAYFDGTGDYLSLTQSALAVKAGNFTIECWTYITGSVSNCGIWQLGSTLFPASQDGLAVAAVSSAWQIYFAGSNTSGGTAALNTWYHLALVRSGTNLRLYVNGISVISVTDSTNYTGTALSIGGYYTTGYLMTGYVSDMRITAGVARYTSNFQPPIAPLTALPNTVLLNNMTGAGIYDSSMMNNYETVGNSSISTSIKKYGNTSMYFDGTGDYLVSSPDPNLSFGTSDFTVEMWVYLNSGSAYQYVIGATANGGMQIGLNVPISGTPTIAVATANGSWILNFGSSITIPSATWSHIAVTRSGSTNRAFINGVQLGSSITDSTNWTFPNNRLQVGATLGAESFAGYIDDLRITRGVARYTTTFTPPASPYIRF